MFLRWPRLSLQALVLCALIGFVESGHCADRSSPANLGTETDALVPAWVPTGSLHTARSFHTATLLPSGKVLVAGGLSQGGLYSAELYDPASGVWTETGAMNVQRRGHTATLLTNGEVLVVGGDGSPDVESLGFTGSSELYDPASETWRTTGRLNTPRAGFSATLLDDGKVLVAGGIDNDDNALASAELYDPATGTWRYTGNLVVARFAHSATRLVDGRVLVVAGSNDDTLQTPLSSAEIYDPAVGIWTAAGTIGTALGTARLDVKATLLQNGKVLVAGGYVNSFGASTSYALAELFDPVTRWSPTGAMNVARAGHTITLLPGGEVLVTGGYDWNFRHDLSSTELYQPSTGTWQTAGSMSTTRFGHTATLLPSGQVLVAGGEVVGLNYANTPLASAELYQAAPPPPAGGQALDVSIGPPGAVTIDGKGNVFFSARNIVFKLDSAGSLTRVAGNGAPGYSGDGGPAVDALLDIPYDQYPELLHDPTGFDPLIGGLAIDASGNLYIADAYNNRVRKVDTSGIITTVAGGDGTNATGAPPLGASLPWPQGVAFDPAGRLYIASAGALDRVSTDGLLTLLAQCASVGPSLCSTGQIAIDGSGNIYVPDACQVRKVSPDGGIVTVAGVGSASCGYSGDGGPAINAKLSGPHGVALDAIGNLYIADTYNNCIRKVDGAGIITTVAGVCVLADPGFYFGDGGPATAARLSLPSGVAIDSALNLYIADTGNDRIRKVTPDGIITTIAGNGREAGAAIEYYYAAWDFYFVTAYPAEAAALDAGAFGGAWKPTGQVFDVWTGPGSQAVPTCRFFNATFAPKSSHVYTPYAAECASLKAGTAWQYEGIAFYVRLPDASGLCAAGTIPLYRAYNDGMGGAPNHRYTTSLTILNQMLAAGWLFEGNGDTKAFACVPQMP